MWWITVLILPSMCRKIAQIEFWLKYLIQLKFAEDSVSKISGFNYVYMTEYFKTTEPEARLKPPAFQPSSLSLIHPSSFPPVYHCSFRPPVHALHSFTVHVQTQHKIKAACFPAFDLGTVFSLSTNSMMLFIVQFWSSWLCRTTVCVCVCVCVNFTGVTGSELVLRGCTNYSLVTL